MFFSFLIFVLFTFSIQEKKEIIWFLSFLFHCTLMHSFFPTLLGYLDSTLVGYIGVIGSSRLELVLDKLYIKLCLLVVAQSYTSFKKKKKHCYIFWKSNHWIACSLRSYQTCQILYQSVVIYYTIYKLFLYIILDYENLQLNKWLMT